MAPRDESELAAARPAPAWLALIETTMVTAATVGLGRWLRPGDVVLVKASRSAGLEGIADEIANFADAWSPSS